MAESIYGKKNRLRALDNYLKTAGPLSASNAWLHVYRLLLSVDRRTRLAHIYDANHMQPGRQFHDRAVNATSLIKSDLGLAPAQDLGPEIDRMFRFCKAKDPIASDPGKHTATFAEEVTSALGSLKLSVSTIEQIVRQVELVAADFFVLERRRQNIRGEGFEDVLEYLLLNVGQVPASQLALRQNAGTLPGFRTRTQRGEKRPKPDIVFTNPSADLTLSILTAKWSLRQDRLDQFGQEAEYYKDNKTQGPHVRFDLITNEFDIARLQGVLNPPAGRGGFHFDVVYHVNLELVRAVQGSARFAPLEVYVQQGRLMSLGDLLLHCRTRQANLRD